MYRDGYRSFEMHIGAYLDKIKQEAEGRAPAGPAYLFLNAPDPRHRSHHLHALPCATVVGTTMYDGPTAVAEIDGNVAYDMEGKARYHIVDDWFYDANTNEPLMWVCVEYSVDWNWMIPPWRKEEVEANAKVVDTAERVKGVLDAEATDINTDTTELCAFLRQQRDTPEDVLRCVDLLEREREIVQHGKEEEKLWWFSRGPGVDEYEDRGR
jgi:hypothetical protein